MAALVREGYHRTGIWRNFRRFFEHSDCSRRTVWALCASLRQEQSISGAEKARKSTCLRWDIPLERVRSCRKLLCSYKWCKFWKNIKFYTLFCLVYRPTKDNANKVERPICTDWQLSIIKVRISPLPRADLWQIFAGLASIAIALQTLFEHRVRVCL